MKKICSKKLDDNFSSKPLETKDEALLVYKIVRAYSDANEEGKLYELLTGESHNNPFLFLEAQPYSQRKHEGNTNLDLAMGSIKKRKGTESGIQYDSKNQEKHFLFLEAKWDSDISVGVKYCTIRNQLQRVIDNALYFSFNPESINKIYVVLLTPKKYKNCFEEKLNSRFYGYKYGEYSLDSSIILRELEMIKSELPWKEGENLDSLIQENIKKLTLNWVTFEELIEKITKNSVKEEIKTVYEKINIKKRDVESLYSAI